MHDLYRILTGPLLWLSVIIFVGGSLFRLLNLLVMVHKKERFIYSYMDVKYSLRSIWHWIIPFASLGWRSRPVLTVMTFLFHICLLITPLFLLSHVVLIDEAWNIKWWTLPDSLADIMTLCVIAGAVFFFVRRLKVKEVRYVTYPSDYLILAITAAPFITGFLAYHQWFAYEYITLLHILTGEIMLAAIPFSRLIHMIFSIFTRIYMGSEFGRVRHATDY